MEINLTHASKTRNPTMSFNMKNGWNGIMFVPLLSPSGLLDPFSCRNARCMPIRANIANGRIKWKTKNRFNVEFETVKPPQIHFTMESPSFGMADSRLVITVAPQYDICPHGST